MHAVYNLMVMSFDFSRSYDRSCLVEHLVYGHYKIGDGFVTVAGARVDEKLYYGLSFCSPEDNFSKESGRENAIEHLTSPDTPHMRGVLNIASSPDEQPAIILKQAAQRHVAKMRGEKRPHWVTNNSVVTFKKPRRDYQI